MPILVRAPECRLAFWIDPDTKEVGLDRPEAILAAEYLAKLIELGISPPLTEPYDARTTAGTFLCGETALMRNWPHVFQKLKSESKEDGTSASTKRVPVALHADVQSGDALVWAVGDLGLLAAQPTLGKLSKPFNISPARRLSKNSRQKPVLCPAARHYSPAQPLPMPPRPQSFDHPLKIMLKHPLFCSRI